MVERGQFELDTYPSPSIIACAWTEAVSVLDASSPTPSVVPSDEGGVMFVWHRGGWDVEVEIDATENTVWAQSRRTGDTWFGPLNDRRGDLRQLLREMARG
jgi:hypothetical protein